MQTSTQRRTFLKRAVAALNGAIGLVVAVPGLRFLLAPLRRRRGQESASGESRFLRVAPLSALSAGRPLRGVVAADRWDAYTHHPPGPIGSVWLLREERVPGAAGDKSEPRIRCLQTICPHLGCGIDYDVDRRAFSCPCHASDFDAAGRRLLGPAPRDMDELECRVTGPDEQGRRWIEVRYQEF